MKIMEENRAEQKEALEVLIEFNDRIVKNMTTSPSSSEQTGYKVDM